MEHKQDLNKKRQEQAKKNRKRENENQKRYGQKTHDINCKICGSTIAINNYKIMYLGRQGFSRKDILASKIIVCKGCEEKGKNEKI